MPTVFIDLFLFLTAVATTPVQNVQPNLSSTGTFLLSACLVAAAGLAALLVGLRALKALLVANGL